MSKQGAPQGYIEVKDRIVAFLEKYPEGSLQPLDPKDPFRIMELGEKTWLVYVAAAYRSASDWKPGIGIAWEEYPGRTPFTKGSELMNAETSAWGRALAALGFEVHRSVASAEEVEQAKARSEPLAEAVTALPGTRTLAGPEILEQIEQKRTEVGTSEAAVLAHITGLHGRNGLDDLDLEEARLVYAWLAKKKARPGKKAA